MVAIDMKNEDCCQLLLSSSVDLGINQIDSEGETAISLALFKYVIH